MAPSAEVERLIGQMYRVNLKRTNEQTIEERNFLGALLLVESHFTGQPPVGRRSLSITSEAVRRTMDKTLNKSEIREVLAKNVDIWKRLQLCFYAALPTLGSRSIRDTYSTVASEGVEMPESSTLIAENHATLHEDLLILNNLLVIARNMLAIKEVAQDICAAVQLDKQVTRIIMLCVNVTSKGYDGENVDALTRTKLSEITELYKKLLVTSLQFLHNLTMGNDRLKMAFWYEMLFDDDLQNDSVSDLPPDGLLVKAVHEEVGNWLNCNSRRSPQAQAILDKYEDDVPLGSTAGSLPEPIYKDNLPAHIEELSTLFPDITEQNYLSKIPSGHAWIESLSGPTRDRVYGRVSHEIDLWWKKVRDANYDSWVVKMESVENAIARAQAGKEAAMTRYIPRVEDDTNIEFDVDDNYDQDRHGQDEDGEDEDDEEDEVDDEEEEEDDSYAEGPLRGLLTEIPNILDTKQIEALHMTVKACVVDAMGSGLTSAGENLQKTRCKMFLALDCGKNLLREMLVFIAVWEQQETQFIFQITAQLVESLHHNALLPYAWNSLRIVKDIVSPAQTVLLRLINYMFRARKNTSIYTDPKEYNRDAKLVHFLYGYFRCRVVPDCISLIHAQANIRNGKNQARDFPVDLWDMERAKDGLCQYLEFISVVADIAEMKPLLIGWEVTYELVALLNALEAGVPRQPLVESRHRPSTLVPTPLASNGTANQSELPLHDGGMPSSPTLTQAPRVGSLPPLHDTPHKFPWTNTKVHIMIILSSLLAPAGNRSGPGNPVVQKQILSHGGMIALLNCCIFDGHNEYLKERATLCIKFTMEGCEEAQQFVRELNPLRNQKQDVEAMRAKGLTAQGPGSMASLQGGGVPDLEL